jgi:pimeloyl-ACP methyl ester carboxylesterase
MLAVFVHGVPETHRTWDAVRERLARDDTIALALPGFDAPVPNGWAATKEEYAEWIVQQLEAVGEPVDLVGHDWGSILVQRVASTRPDLVRTLACGAGPLDRDYVWHDLAQAWQTPDVGEQIMTGLTPDALRVGLEAELGPGAAATMAAHLDETMKACILPLYRSAVTVGAEWQDAVDALGESDRGMPFLAIWGRDDIYAPPEYGRRLAARLHGDYLELDTGHFWPITRPAPVAEALETLWARA